MFSVTVTNQIIDMARIIKYIKATEYSKTKSKQAELVIAWHLTFKMLMIYYDLHLNEPAKDKQYNLKLVKKQQYDEKIAMV